MAFLADKQFYRDFLWYFCLGKSPRIKNINVTGEINKKKD